MKPYLLLLCLLIYRYPFAQTYFNTAVPTSEYYVETIYCPAYINSSDKILTLALSKFRNKYGYLNKIIELDKGGKLVRINEYLDSINSQTVFALKKTNYGYISSGYKFRSSDTINHFWFAKLDNNLDTIWTKNVKKKYNNSSFNNIIELKNKSIALCGTDMLVRRSGTFLSTIPVLAIADSLGNINKYVEIRGTDTTGGEGFYGISEGFDHSIYASGYIVKLDNLLDQDPIIAKVDSSGNLLWRKQIINKGFNEIFKSTLTQKDGSILGIGASYNDYGASKEFSYVLLINFDSDGNINWTKRIFKGLINDFSNAIQDYNGNIIGAGLYNRYRGLYADTSAGHGWIFKCSATGDSIWSRSIVHASEPFPERFNNISQADDGGFYLTGYTFVPDDYSSKAWIVKTDSFGCVVPGCQNIVSTEDIKSGKEKAFVMFPNPVSERFFFLSRITNDEPLQMLMDNLKGELVQTYKFRAYEGHQYQVDLKEDIPSGLYNVTIVNAKGMVLFSEKLEKV
ncbi:MAG: hypothetical protein HOP11_10290 [Saprospiraceae bacterium]|nr:hypothetical protein [Saprospiraceae bacterium]